MTEGLRLECSKFGLRDNIQYNSSCCYIVVKESAPHRRSSSPEANSPIVSPPLRNKTRPMLLLAANDSRGMVVLFEEPEIGGRS